MKRIFIRRRIAKGEGRKEFCCNGSISGNHQNPPYRPCIQSRCTSTLVASSLRSENVCLTSNASVYAVLVLRESPRSRYYFSSSCKLKLRKWKNGPIKSRPVYDIPLHENPEFVRDTSFVTEFYSSRQKTNVGKVSFYSF